jgi:hypothetical protein
MRPHARIDIRSTADGEVLRTIPVADEEILYSVAWADAGLVTVVSRDSSRKEGRVNVEIVDPTTGASRPTGFQAGYGTRLVGPTDDGKVFAQEVVESDTVDGKQHPTGYSLRPIDVAAARVGPPIADASGRPLQFSGWGRGLSPNGRFALVTDVVGDPNTSHVVDLQAVKGDGVISAPRWSFWVDGDRLIWRETLEHRTRMFVGTPGGPPRPIREWREANVGIFPSPDRRAVFVSVLPAGGAPSAAAGRAVPDTADFQAGVTQGSATEEIVYLPGEDRFVTLGHPFSDRPSDQRYSVWAGPKTLARIAPGVVYLEDIDRPGALRFVIGGSRDLE